MTSSLFATASTGSAAWDTVAGRKEVAGRVTARAGPV
jgi:hypothetical protein